MATIKETSDDQRVEHAISRTSVEGMNAKDTEADILHAQQLAAEWEDGSPAEKKLLRKLDWRILPCCWVLYLLGFLDRANVRFVESLHTRGRLFFC